MLIRTSLIAAACIAIAAPATAQTMAPAEFVAKAGASDLYEKESSRLVLQTTRDPKVREFANMMIAHHTKSTADVKAAAKQARMTPKPPMLEPMQQQMVTELRSEQGEARDTRYIAQQKTAHQQALALHTGYATDGTSPPLKAAAGKIAPVVQSHIDKLNAM